jgi:glucose/arabinose dehydrogenase
MNWRWFICVSAGCCVAPLAAFAIMQAPGGGAGESPAAQAPDPEGEWAVEQGFVLTIDSEGFNLPTAIAFVPQPGPAPKHPLYFITEIRGTVKVVTNDRTVETFASDFVQVVPERELPERQGQVGVAGICLDPERGYVFVTFAYPDSAGVLRNNIVRFQSTPGTFSLRATGQVDFRHIFAGAVSSSSHQIGGCQVSGDHLYVGVGDALESERGQDLKTVLGKILRLTVDGEPVPSNPFYREAAGEPRVANSTDYIWAYGLRNPFGLKLVDGELYVAENGINIDRFLRVRAGENYLWDGSDLSIGARADLVIAPPVGPVQLEYASGTRAGDPWPASYGENFFMALSAEQRPGVMRFPYARDVGRPLGKPEFLLRYRGSGIQFVSGVALGPDGLYVVPIMPDQSGRSAVLRLHHDPQATQPSADDAPANVAALMDEKGCLSCHTVGPGAPGRGGPRLYRDSLWARLSDRLITRRYRRTVAELEHRTEEPIVTWRDERAALLTAPQPQRMIQWTTYKILEPRFDDPGSTMPNLSLSRAEAEAIARFLVLGDGSSPPSRLERRALELRRKLLPTPLRVWHLAVGGVIGFAAGMLATWMSRRIWRRRTA